MARKDYNRPILLSIIAVLSVIMGLLVCLSGVMLVLGGAALSVTDLFAEGSPLASMGAVGVGAVFLLLGLLIVFVGLGLFSGKAWAWWLTVIVYGLNAIFGIIGLIFGGGAGIIPLLFALLVLFYMTRKNTKGWFGV